MEAKYLFLGDESKVSRKGEKKSSSARIWKWSGKSSEKVLKLCESCRMRSSWTDGQNRLGLWCSFFGEKEFVHK
jgi:hypothetical protein